MSERSDVMPSARRRVFRSEPLLRVCRCCWLWSVLISLGLCVVGAFVDRVQFSFSWLFAFAFFFTLIAGCFFWIIVHHVTDAEWSVVVRRQLENLALLMP